MKFYSTERTIVTLKYSENAHLSNIWLGDHFSSIRLKYKFLSIEWTLETSKYSENAPWTRNRLWGPFSLDKSNLQILFHWEDIRNLNIFWKCTFNLKSRWGITVKFYSTERIFETLINSYNAILASFNAVFLLIRKHDRDRRVLLKTPKYGFMILKLVQIPAFISKNKYSRTFFDILIFYCLEKFIFLILR